MAYKLCILLIFTCSIGCVVLEESIEGTCDARTGQCPPAGASASATSFDIPIHKPKRYSEPESWQKFRAEIENAKLIYEQRKADLEKTDCSIYNDALERDLSPFTEKGISRALFLKASKEGVRYQIVNKTLYRSKMVLYAHRCAGVEHFLHRIIPNLGANVTLEFVVNDRDVAASRRWSVDAESRLFAHEPLPVFSYWKPFNAEFDPSYIERQIQLNFVNYSDVGGEPTAANFEPAKASDQRRLQLSESYYDILMPSWTFWEGGPILWPFYPGPQGLGRWDLAREHIEKKIWREYEWNRKIPIGFFRGTRIGAYRDALVRLSAAKPQLVNAEFTKSHHWKSVADTLGFQPAVEVGLIDHCRYKQLFNFDGIGASVRFRHLFLCRSLVLAVNPEAKREFFTDSLIKWYHYVPVPSNATESDLETLISFFSAHDSLAEQIADNGYRFIRNHLRLEDVECYWRRLLRRYASLVRYNVERDPQLVEIPFNKFVDSTGKQ